MTDAKELVKRARKFEAWLDHNPPAQWGGEYQYIVDLYGQAVGLKMLVKEAAAFIEAHDKPPLSREEMRNKLADEYERAGANRLQVQRIRTGVLLENETAALAFGEAIQRHFTGGE